MFNPLELPDDLPEEIKVKLSSMSPAEAAGWLVIHSDQAREIAAHNSALLSMNDAEKQVAEACGISPADYVKWKLK